MELVLRLLGSGSFFQLVFWGELIFFRGLLMILLNHWIAPIIGTYPVLVKPLQGYRTSYKTGDETPTLMIKANTLL